MLVGRPGDNKETQTEHIQKHMQETQTDETEHTLETHRPKQKYNHNL